MSAALEIDQSQIDSLARNPSEGLNVEIKRWIDPDTPEGKSKIVRGCLALRNRNGGHFVIGFDDKTLLPDVANQPPDPQAMFRLDPIQNLISSYASDLFEIGLAFGKRDGVCYPVIVVPAGVRVPVVAKKELLDPSNKVLVVQNGVYFRTLNSSGIASTSLARHQDWRDIVDICFENREADIGRFLRRQLTGVDRTMLSEALVALGFATGANPPPTRPSLRNEAESFLVKGEARFQAAIQTRGITPQEKALVDGLTMEVAMVINPGWEAAIPDRAFLAKVLGSNPQYTGWPIWLDARTLANEDNRPKVVDQFWEALVISTESWSPHMDFMRLDPCGRFYLHRAMQDDLAPDRIAPKTSLDPILMVIRVAEAIAVGIAMARALITGDEAERQLGFAFRWTKVGGRILTSWANPMAMMPGSPRSHDQEVTSFIEIPADIPINAIAPFVGEATRSLFVTFEGERVAPNVIEDWTAKLLERRLGF